MLCFALFTLKGSVFWASETKFFSQIVENAFSEDKNFRGYKLKGSLNEGQRRTYHPIGTPVGFSFSIFQHLHDIAASETLCWCCLMFFNLYGPLAELCVSLFSSVCTVLPAALCDGPFSMELLYFVCSHQSKSCRQTVPCLCRAWLKQPAKLQRHSFTIDSCYHCAWLTV